MSNIRQDDIDNLLASWADAKEQISSLEHTIEKYKRLATRILNKNNTEQINNNTFTLRRRHISKRTVSKQDLPSDIWNQYSKQTEFTAFYLSKQ